MSSSELHSMAADDELVLRFDRAPFFRIGRALQHAIGPRDLGDVLFDARDGRFLIESDWGGGEIECHFLGTARATISARAFCALVSTRYREKAPSGTMEFVFRPAFGEVAIDRAGVKARFSQ